MRRSTCRNDPFPPTATSRQPPTPSRLTNNSKVEYTSGGAIRGEPEYAQLSRCSNSHDTRKRRIANGICDGGQGKRKQHRYLLQGLGQGATSGLQPWLAAERGRL